MMKKRIIPALCVLMAFLMTVATWAGDAELLTPARSGECGATEDDTVTWEVDDSGTLTISGTGEMAEEPVDKPWNPLCYEITSVVIENGVTNISAYAFRDFPLLESVTIADTVETIGNTAFEHCTSLRTLVMGNGVKVIGADAFASCYQLEDFALPESLLAIESSAFWACYALRAVQIPDNVRYIGNWLYGDCNLESIVFGRGISVIRSGVLSRCDTVRSITIPSGVRVIEDVFGESAATPVIYYAGAQTRWNALYGYGQAELTEKAERIYFESSGSDSEAMFTVSFPDVSEPSLEFGNDGNLLFDVQVTGNVLQPVHFVLTFYDEDGKFLHMLETTDKVSAETESVDIYLDDIANWMFEPSRTLKFMAFDENFAPYCAPQTLENV